MNCTDILPLLSGHLDQANTTDEETLLQTHLAQCADCRALLKCMEQNDILLAADGVEPPAELTARIMSQVRKKRKPRRSAVISWVASGVAAAALLGFAIMGDFPSADLRQDDALRGNENAAVKEEAAEVEAVEPYAAFEDSEARDGAAQTGGIVPKETIARSGGTNDGLKTRRGVEALLPEGTPPFLLICGAEAADFSLLDDYAPDKDKGTVLLPKDSSAYNKLIAAMAGGLPQDSIAAAAKYRTFTVYTVPREVMLALYECCDFCEAYLYDPETLSDTEECRVVFVQESDAAPLLPQSTE